MPNSGETNGNADHKMPQTPKKEKKLHELLTSAMVDIYVGEDSTHWPIHERLLCYHSPFFSSIFYDKKATSRPGTNKSYGLPEDDDLPFELLVGWLYSGHLKTPTEEKEVGHLLDLYLLADRFQMEKLGNVVTDTVRDFYHTTSTYPGLRRVQYIYANTEEDNQMRELMVSSIARFLALGEKIPLHWANALKKNGQLAVDIIRSIQEWHIEDRNIPDARDRSIDRGRGIGFSDVEEKTNGVPEDQPLTNGNGHDVEEEEEEDGEEAEADGMEAEEEEQEEGEEPAEETK